MTKKEALVYLTKKEKHVSLQHKIMEQFCREEKYNLLTDLVWEISYEI